MSNQVAGSLVCSTVNQLIHKQPKGPVETMSKKYRRDGVVARASASQSADLGVISQVESYQKTLKNGIHSFPAWRSANRDSVKNKTASLLVLSLGKTLKCLHLYVADRWWNQAVYPSW